MMIGHGLLAFALVAGWATIRGWPDRRALALGAVAAGFGTLPDVDMLYAFWGLLAHDVPGVFAVNEVFWTASEATHRSATHSLVVGAPAALAFGLWARRRAGAGLRTAGTAVLGAIVVAGYLASGSLDAVMLAAFSLTGVGLALAARRWTDLSWRATTGAALVGLLTHPFGDLFTGGPPRLLYPLGPQVLDGRALLSADPTVHLLATFLLEVAAVWLAAAVYLRLSDRSLSGYVRPSAALGAGYGAIAVVLPPPTLAVPKPFVFSILAVGVGIALLVLVGSPRRAAGTAVADGGGFTPRRWSGIGLGNAADSLLAAALTGTAAVTVAWAAYLGVYLAG